ncbi:MAG: aminopeptidase P family protein, partial [Clostridia bacterium]|nr:aminopeptidase P family protein [Clostridia bacterium]
MINTISKVKSIIPENCDGVLITNPSDMVYLTDLVGIEGFIIINRDKATLYTDGRYIETAEKNIDFMNVALLKSGVNVNTASKENGCKRVCCQGGISASRFNTLNQNGDVSFDLNPQFDAELSAIRMVKTQREISRMKEAQSITDSAFAHALNIIKVGMSERELAAELDFYMRKNGSDGTAFDTIAISGENTSLPHGIPTDKKIQKGDFVTMDFGA